jgi:acetyl-CoA carboxylase carboxyltransferase component
MESMDEKIKELRARREHLEAGGRPKQVEKQHKRGKMTARERIKVLLDPGTFSEIDLWALPRKTGFDIDERELPADGVIVGSGEIDSRPVYIYAQDFTVMGGTVGSIHARKIIKVMEKALKMRIPCIGLIDSGGVRVQDAVSREYRNSYHTMFYLHTLSSGVIPQISLMMGPCAAGASYSPILTDFCIMVKKTSYMYIAGPPLVKAVTSLDVTSEELGGAEVHARISGCCDLLTEDDEDCLKRARNLLGYLPLNNREKPPYCPNGDDPDREILEFSELVPINMKKPYDIRRVIEKVVDREEFLEIKPDWAKNMVIGFGRLDGYSVGIVANQPYHLGGAIDINAADKEARFIRFCDAFNIPLIFFVDTPAYLPGVAQEHGGIIRHGAKVLFAISESTVPKITVFVRKGYGGGAPAMCTEPMGSDLVLAWPTAELGLMGAEGAVSIIYRKQIASSTKPEETRQSLLAEYMENFGKFPYHAAAMGWVEDIIEPKDTRKILIKALKRFRNKCEERPWKKHGNIPL